MSVAYAFGVKPIIRINQGIFNNLMNIIVKKFLVSEARKAVDAFRNERNDSEYLDVFNSGVLVDMKKARSKVCDIMHKVLSDFERAKKQTK